jgi:5-methyltetrahydropteroyltriglutamate--homocysteine methyltransferase
VHRSDKRILVTHVGSLIRPPRLRALIRGMLAGKPVDESEYQACLKDSVTEVVREQVDVGIDSVSDGEFGKSGWSIYVAERLGGLEQRTLRDDEKESLNPFADTREGKRFAEFQAAYDPVRVYDWDPASAKGGRLQPPPAAPTTVWECTGPITYKGQAAIDRDISNLKVALARTSAAEAFLPVAAPMSARGRRGNQYYPSEHAYVAALAEAMKSEYQAIVDAGFLLQLDDAFLATDYDRLLGEMAPAQVHKHAESRVELMNYALSDIPEDRIRYHVCWGSWNAPHTSDVPLKTLIDLILRVRAQAYLIEAANPRHEHEWQVWKDVKLPDGKILVPGLVSHSTNVVEHPELVQWRIKNFANLVGRENVIAGTDCGFSQNWNIVRVHPSIQWAKLEALVEGARLASSDLWPRAPARAGRQAASIRS